MNFCSGCGQPTELRVPAGDHLPRYVCTGCGTVHYQNPRVVVGCVPEHEGKILLCRRAIEPRLGFWTIPAGFMENGESLQQGAARECFEEACAPVTMGSLLAVVSIPEAQQVHVFFRAQMDRLEFAAGVESLEVMLVTPEQIPWDQIAFPSTRFALEQYLASPDSDLPAGRLTATLSRRAPG